MRAAEAVAWAPALSGATAKQALSVAREVGARMTDPTVVAGYAALAGRQTSFTESVRWRPQDVAQGEAGLSLLFGQLAECLPEPAWETAAHRYLSSAARGAERTGHRLPGLYSGLGGVAFVAWTLSRDGARYQRLLAELDRWLVADATTRGDALARGPWGGPFGVFDAISGLAGTAGYLLCRRENPAADEALRAVLAGLVALCGERDGLPNWHTPRYALPPSQAEDYPHGHLNCGLAHGIPGPLTVLALALAQGVEVAGMTAAVRGVADWLVAHRADDEWGVNWPYAVALPSGERAATPSRSAWCYGSPGVARALWLAGSALGDDALCALAVEAMAATYRRPRGRRGIDSPTFCHGVAGLLQITLRFANDTGDPLFRVAAEDLTEQLLAQYAPERPLGYYSLEPGGNRVDQPGLLDGAPGVALTLLAAATDVPPVWDRLFLLS